MYDAKEKEVKSKIAEIRYDDPNKRRQKRAFEKV